MSQFVAQLVRDIGTNALKRKMKHKTCYQNSKEMSESNSKGMDIGKGGRTYVLQMTIIFMTMLKLPRIFFKYFIMF